MYNNFKYAIINSSEKGNVNTTELMAIGRRSNDDSKFIVTYENEQPSSLNSVTEYTHQEILEELEKSEWKIPLPTALQEYLDGL